MLQHFPHKWEMIVFAKVAGQTSQEVSLQNSYSPYFRVQNPASLAGDQSPTETVQSSSDH